MEALHSRKMSCGSTQKGTLSHRGLTLGPGPSGAAAGRVDRSRGPGGVRPRRAPLGPRAARLSETNTSPIAQAAFAAGLNLLDSVGVRWVQTRISNQVDAVIDVIDGGGAVLTSPRRTEQRAGIVSFSVAGVSGQDLHTALTREGVTCTRHGDRIRLAVHATTSAEAITRVKAAL